MSRIGGKRKGREEETCQAPPFKEGMGTNKPLFSCQVGCERVSGGKKGIGGKRNCQEPSLKRSNGSSCQARGVCESEVGLRVR